MDRMPVFAQFLVDVEAFAKAMEGEGKSKEGGDKKDDEEDMSLD